ncbi:probable E3 ubiquitin-protein ligase RNF217 [Tanacetum coccineum]
MIKYIQAKLDDNVSDIKCPHESCNHSLEPLSCGTKISHKLFNRWCDALCESTVLGFDLVYCPNKECSELIMNEFSDGDVKRCVCPSCLKPFCYQCKAPWHDGYTCEETRDGNNVDFEVVCEKNWWNWKRCPKCRYRWEELGLVGRISTLGIKWKGQDFKGTWWSALASWALEVYKKLGGRWVSKRVYGYGRMQEVLVWMKVWKMRENLDVDSCDSDSLRMLQCSCAFLSGFAEKEDVRGWESDLVDSFEKAQFLMISGDCGNVTTDDNEDVTPVIAPEKDSIIAPPSTPPGNDLNIAVESGSSGLLIIGPLNSDEIDSDKRWSYRNPMGI